MVRRLPQRPVILALIEDAFLVGAGLGSQGYGGMITVGPHTLCHLPHKVRKGFPVLRQNILKVDVHSLITLLCHGLQQIVNQLVYRLLVLYHIVNQIIAEAPLFVQGRQGQDGRGTVLQRHCDHPVVRQRRGQKLPLGGKSIGKNSQFRQIGQRIRQHCLIDVGIGIARDPQGTVGLPCPQVDKKSLPQGKLIWINNLVNMVG